MEILFQSTRDCKLFSAQKELVRTFGESVAKRVMQRLYELAAASSLLEISHLPPPRCHQLTNVIQPTYSVDVSPRLRLLFTPTLPIPLSEDGSVDRARVFSITIVEVRDTHEGKVRR